MVALVSRSSPGPQGVLQLPVEPFHQSVRDLWVVSYCWGVADVVQVEEGCP
jgi:hypothetical protein